MMLTIRLNISTPSLNTWQRLHWTKKRKAQERWWALIKEQVGPDNPRLDRAQVRIERRCIQPIRDIDNLYGGLKPVLDGLVRAGVLADDDQERIADLSVIQLIVDKRIHVGTTIKVKRLPASDS